MSAKIDEIRAEVNRRLDWFKELMAVLDVPAEKVVEVVKGLLSQGLILRSTTKDLEDFLDLLATNLKVKDGEWANWNLGQRIGKVLVAHDEALYDAQLGRRVKEIAKKYPDLHLTQEGILTRVELDVDRMWAFNKPIDLLEPTEEERGTPWPDAEFQPVVPASARPGLAEGATEPVPPVLPTLPSYPAPSPEPSVIEPVPTEIVDVACTDGTRTVRVGESKPLTCRVLDQNWQDMKADVRFVVSNGDNARANMAVGNQLTGRHPGKVYVMAYVPQVSNVRLNEVFEVLPAPGTEFSPAREPQPTLPAPPFAKASGGKPPKKRPGFLETLGLKPRGK